MSNGFAHGQYRLPCKILQGYEIRCHLNGFLDWRKEPFPRLGLCCRCCRLCILGRTGDHPTSCSAEVCPSHNLFSHCPTHISVSQASGRHVDVVVESMSVRADPARSVYISLCIMLVRIHSWFHSLDNNHLFMNFDLPKVVAATYIQFRRR